MDHSKVITQTTSVALIAVIRFITEVILGLHFLRWSDPLALCSLFLLKYFSVFLEPINAGISPRASILSSSSGLFLEHSAIRSKPRGWPAKRSVVELLRVSGGACFGLPATTPSCVSQWRYRNRAVWSLLALRLGVPDLLRLTPCIFCIMKYFAFTSLCKYSSGIASGLPLSEGVVRGTTRGASSVVWHLVTLQYQSLEV